MTHQKNNDYFLESIQILMLSGIDLASLVNFIFLKYIFSPERLLLLIFEKLMGSGFLLSSGCI